MPSPACLRNTHGYRIRFVSLLNTNSDASYLKNLLYTELTTRHDIYISVLEAMDAIIQCLRLIVCDSRDRQKEE